MCAPSLALRMPLSALAGRCCFPLSDPENRRSAVSFRLLLLSPVFSPRRDLPRISVASHSACKAVRPGYRRLQPGRNIVLRDLHTRGHTPSSTVKYEERGVLVGGRRGGLTDSCSLANRELRRLHYTWYSNSISLCFINTEKSYSHTQSQSRDRSWRYLTSPARKAGRRRRTPRSLPMPTQGAGQSSAACRQT